MISRSQFQAWVTATFPRTWAGWRIWLLTRWREEGGVLLGMAALLTLFAIIWLITYSALYRPPAFWSIDSRGDYLAFATPALKNLGKAAAVATAIFALLWALLKDETSKALAAFAVAYFFIAAAAALYLHLQAKANHENLPIARATSVSFDLAARTLRIDGGLPPTLPRTLKNIPPDARFDTLYLGNNRGGDVQQVFLLMDLLPAWGVRQVVIDGDCQSNCAYLAVLMPHRLLARSGKLGFHDLWSVMGLVETVKRDRRTLIALLTERGIDPAVATDLFSTQPIRHLSPEFMLEHRLIDACVDGRSQKIPCDF